jgi:hypothetical protein
MTVYLVITMYLVSMIMIKFIFRFISKLKKNNIYIIIDKRNRFVTN